MKNTWAVYGALFLGVLAISTSAIFVKLSGDAPSSAIAFYRLGITTLVLLPFLLFWKARRDEVRCLSKRQLGLIAVSGVLLAVHYVMWFESLRYTSIASSTVLVCLSPLFSIAFAYLFLRTVPGKSGIIGCLIAIFGCVLIGSSDFQISGIAFLGDCIAFAAAAGVALYFLIGETVRKTTSAVTYSVLCYGIAVVFLFVYALVIGDPLLGFSFETVAALVGLALISTIGGQFLFNILLKHVSSTAVTMSVLGEPIGTCILAYFIFGEGLSLMQFTGICVILLGLGIYFLYPALREKKSERSAL